MTKLPNSGLQGETGKAVDRRVRELFFEKYCRGKGIDIGCGNNPLGVAGIDKWDQDLGHGDATFMAGIPDHAYDFVYSSHCIEHLVFPYIGMRNWWRILKPGGWLIVFGPERNIYERRLTLPSRWNGDHKTFWLLDRSDPPTTFSVLEMVQHCCPGYELHSLRLLDEGNTKRDKPDEHADGEFSWEIICKKAA